MWWGNSWYVNLWAAGYQSPFYLLHISAFLTRLALPALFFTPAFLFALHPSKHIFPWFQFSHMLLYCSLSSKEIFFFFHSPYCCFAPSLLLVFLLWCFLYLLFVLLFFTQVHKTSQIKTLDMSLTGYERQRGDCSAPLSTPALQKVGHFFLWFPFRSFLYIAQ